MAMLAFIDNAAMTTARQSENALRASEAATASINRGEATLAPWPLKPCAPVNRVMAGKSLESMRGRITRNVAGTVAFPAGNIAAGLRRIRRRR
jgi:hypothetical protein